MYVADSRGATKHTTMCTGEASVTTSGDAFHPKLPGNTFECLAQFEEECPSGIDKNLEESRSEPNAIAEFSDTSPIFDTFKQVKRIDKLDFTAVPLSKKKLNKLKKQNQASKQASNVGGSGHLSNG